MRLCHYGNCGPCPLLPSLVTHCPCGKSLIENKRSKCTDPIESCGKPCMKAVEGCGHPCVLKCHTGDCLCIFKRFSAFEDALVFYIRFCVARRSFKSCFLLVCGEYALILFILNRIQSGPHGMSLGASRLTHRLRRRSIALEGLFLGPMGDPKPDPTLPAASQPPWNPATNRAHFECAILGHWAPNILALIKKSFYFSRNISKKGKPIRRGFLSFEIFREQ
ncbi:hypothetical protein ACOME3_001591 [Neoechinorhynchus agilis]